MIDWPEFLDQRKLHVTTNAGGQQYVPLAKKKLARMMPLFSGFPVKKILEIDGYTIYLTYTPERSEIVIEGGKDLFLLTDNSYGFLEGFSGSTAQVDIADGDSEATKAAKWFKQVQPRGVLEDQEPLFWSMTFSIPQTFHKSTTSAAEKESKIKNARLSTKQNFLWCADNYREDLFHRRGTPADSGAIGLSGGVFREVDEWYRRVYLKKQGGTRTIGIWAEIIGYLPFDSTIVKSNAMQFDYRTGEPVVTQGTADKINPIGEYPQSTLCVWDAEAQYMTPTVSYDMEGQRFVFSFTDDIIGYFPFPVPESGDPYTTQVGNSVWAPGLVGLQDAYEGQTVAVDVTPGAGAEISELFKLGIITDDSCILPLSWTYLIVDAENPVKQEADLVIGASTYVNSDSSTPSGEKTTYRHTATMTELVSPHGHGVVLKRRFTSVKEEAVRESGCYQAEGGGVRGCSGNFRGNVSNKLDIEVWHAPEWVDTEKLWFYVAHETKRYQRYFGPNYCFPDTPCSFDAGIEEHYRINGGFDAAKRSFKGKEFLWFESYNHGEGTDAKFKNTKIPEESAPSFCFRDVRGGTDKGMPLSWCRYDHLAIYPPQLFWKPDEHRTLPWFDPYHGVNAWENGGTGAVFGRPDKTVLSGSFTNYAAGKDTAAVPGDDVLAMIEKVSERDLTYMDLDRMPFKDYALASFFQPRPAGLNLQGVDLGLDGHQVADTEYAWFALLENTRASETWSSRGWAYMWPRPSGSSQFRSTRTLDYWFLLDLMVHDGTFGTMICSCRWLRERKDKDGKEQLDGLALWAPSPLLYDVHDSRPTWSKFADELADATANAETDTDVYANPVTDDNVGMGNKSVIDVGKEAEKAVRNAIAGGDIDGDKDIDYRNPLYFLPVIRTTFVLYNNFAPLGLIALIQDRGTHGFIV